MEKNVKQRLGIFINIKLYMVEIHHRLQKFVQFSCLHIIISWHTKFQLSYIEQNYCNYKINKTHYFEFIYECIKHIVIFRTIYYIC